MPIWDKRGIPLLFQRDFTTGVLTAPSRGNADSLHPCLAVDESDVAAMLSGDRPDDRKTEANPFSPGYVMLPNERRVQNPFPS
ncbi:hypothetical protein [Rhizobium bangladeshense]|uniref:hypothetical protein n=1 Tax=Rhizobium bangladeshense TaxID=1138189 RepID=UPI001C83B3E2|nr:hypothetical protein [Rhizobium bangladeshense]MBX4898736.1 hypothetical protein [Rhizobium bangladeshense]MBY3616759.1 hypothetical protein [Rhizobium bangladeshense]